MMVATSLVAGDKPLSDGVWPVLNIIGNRHDDNEPAIAAIVVFECTSIGIAKLAIL